MTQVLEQWDKSDSAKVECDSCGKVRPCVLLPDPYLEAVINERELQWFCKPCFEERKADV